MIQQAKITVTLTGASGSAKSSAPISGKILAIHLDYTDIAAATTDVVIATTATPTMPILTRTDSVADGWFFPRAALCDISAAALLYAAGGTPVTGEIPVDDYVTVSVAQADAGSVVATILWDDMR